MNETPEEIPSEESGGAPEPEAPRSDTPAPEPSEAAPPVPESDVGSESEALDRALQEAGSESAGFSRGEALSGREAAAIAAERRATVIVLAGGTGSGKTTLLASFYERFGRGPLGGHSFDGSRTLHGFELRCHRSVYGSGPGSGDQGHTSTSALPWLHLRLVRDDREGEVFELLLGDYSGEHFETLASGADKPADFPELRRADHLCLVLDGGAMAKPSLRSAEQREAVELLRALLSDPDGLADPTVLSIVVTKWDLVHAAGEEARNAVQEAFASLQKELDERASGAAVGYLETAARSTIAELPLGHGVDDLLARWTDRPALRIRHRPENQEVPANEIDRFGAGT